VAKYSYSEKTCGQGTSCSAAGEERLQHRDFVNPLHSTGLLLRLGRGRGDSASNPYFVPV